jgi:outer membrane receptor protein involved in Fe transport
MKRLAFALCLAAAAGLLSGATLEGLVRGPDGQPLAHALVRVDGGRGSAITDRDGRFRLDTDTKPPFDLLLRRADGTYLNPARVDALPAAGRILEVTAAAAIQEEIRVSPASADLDVPPAAAQFRLDAERLRQEAPRQLIDVLADVPGASRAGDGMAAVPVLRGMAQSRTLLLLDEGRVTSERRAGPSASFLDLATVDEVEILRGPCSVAYGSDAFGGVIQSRTRLPAPGDPFALEYLLEGGTTGWERAASAGASVPLGGGGLLAGGGFRKLDNYDSPEGEVPDSGGSLFHARAGYQRAVGGGLLRALWRSDVGRDIGKPAASAGLTHTLYPEDNSHRLALGYEHAGPPGWSRLSVSGLWDDYRLVTRRVRNPAGDQAGSVTDADVNARDYGIRGIAERPLGHGQILFGVDANGRYGLTADNRTRAMPPDGPPGPETVEESITNARRDDLGFFTGGETDAGPVNFSGGLRVDRATSRNEGGYFGPLSTAHVNWSGFLAGTVSISREVALTAQAARGFRDALLSDRYYRGISGRGFITGNPDLLPETSAQFDLGLRLRSGRFAAAGYAYLYRIYDLIERYRQGLDYYFRNRGSAEYRGLELEASAALPGRFQAQLAAQIERGWVRDDGSPVDSVPPAGFSLTLRRDAPRWWWLGRLTAADRDTRPGPTERFVPGYAVVDTGAGVRFGERLELQVLLRNLLDQPYFNSADVETVLAPGRSVLITLRGTLP